MERLALDFGFFIRLFALDIAKFDQLLFDLYEITIPLDSQLDAKGNAQKYFDRYNKLKRTYEALTKLTEDLSL